MLFRSSLGLDPNKATVVTRDQVNYAKPDPDLFVEAARRLGTTAQGSYVVGDSIWDMLAAARCGALGIGLLSGGYGREELMSSGALRVYEDPADMLDHLDEIAPRTRYYRLAAPTVEPVDTAVQLSSAVHTCGQ